VGARLGVGVRLCDRRTSSSGHAGPRSWASDLDAIGGRTKEPRFRLANVLGPEYQLAEIPVADLVWRPFQRPQRVVCPPRDPIGQNDRGDCFTDCAAIRDLAIQAANDNFNAAVEAARAIRDANNVSANQTYQTALQDAEQARADDLATRGASMHPVRRRMRLAVSSGRRWRHRMHCELHRNACVVCGWG
jgi:hypothetical protein